MDMESAAEAGRRVDTPGRAVVVMEGEWARRYGGKSAKKYDA